MAQRMAKLENYNKVFNGDHSEVYEDQYKRISRIIGNFDEICSFAVVLNYQKKISIKTADLLLGELPCIVTTTESKQESVEMIVENTDFWNTLYQTTIDVSRYGDGILMVYKDAEKAQIDVIPTQYWIPVVDPDNIKRTLNHVIAYTYKKDKTNYIKFQIHFRGYYIVRIHELTACNLMGISNKIGKLVSEEEVQTGLSDFAIVPLSNISSSDSIYGISDYDDVDSIISELEVRIAQIAKILDKHADPSMQIPGCVVDSDPETGEAKVKLGDAFVIDSKDSVEPKYITWDGELKSNFDMIQLLLDQLGIMSELGNLFLGNGLEKLGAISGVALKKMAFNAIAKMNRLHMRIGPAIIKVIKLASELGGSDISVLTKEKMSITFGDGIPSEWTELTEYLAKAVESRIMSRQTAIIKMNDGMDQDELDKELALIDADIKVGTTDPNKKPDDTNNNE
jgi:hypothetical protein